MEITSFQLSTDKTTIEVTLTNAEDATILRFWTDKTYKNFNQVIDLSSKLNSQSSQSFTITLSDISEPFFDGVYFIELKDPDETANAITSELARFKECIMDKLRAQSTCDSCLSKEGDILIAQATLLNLEYAISLLFPSQIITFKKTLDKYCSNACRSCGDYSNVTTVSGAKDTLNPDTVIVKIDGGSLD